MYLFPFLENGKLLVCGDNDYGQLGLNKTEKQYKSHELRKLIKRNFNFQKFSIKLFLSKRISFQYAPFDRKIIQISTGASHTLILTGFPFIIV